MLVDRPETDNKITRVTGAFCVEGTIPTPVDVGIQDEQIQDSGETTFTDRMLEILRKSPLLRLEGNRTLALKNIRPPAKTLSLSAEALVDATAPGQSPTLQDAIQEAAEKNGKALALSAKPVALVFGPENGAISERLVQEAAKEASLKNYTHLYVIGFAIQPNARQLIENCDAVVGIPATYIQATPDLLMGDLLKNMRSSQIFSVCGLPEIKVHPVAPGLSPAPAGLKAGATKTVPPSRAAVRRPQQRCIRSNCSDSTCLIRSPWRRTIERATTFRRGFSIPTITASASTFRRHSFHERAHGII